MGRGENQDVRFALRKLLPRFLRPKPTKENVAGAVLRLMQESRPTPEMAALAKHMVAGYRDRLDVFEVGEPLTFQQREGPREVDQVIAQALEGTSGPTLIIGHTSPQVEVTVVLRELPKRYLMLDLSGEVEEQRRFIEHLLPFLEDAAQDIGCTKSILRFPSNDELLPVRGQLRDACYEFPDLRGGPVTSVLAVKELKS